MLPGKTFFFEAVNFYSKAFQQFEHLCGLTFSLVLPQEGSQRKSSDPASGSQRRDDPEPTIGSVS